MRKFILCLLSFCLLVSILGLTACAKNKHNVNFICDGEIYETFTTAGNEPIQLPSAPSKTGHIFGGWYLDNGTWENMLNVNAYINKELDADLNVYAKWVEETSPEPSEPSGPESISVASVELDNIMVFMETGQHLTLNATVIPSNATNKAVTWASSNNNVATVNNGVVTAVAKGLVTITVTTVDGNKTASCTISVTSGKSVSSVELNKAVLSLSVNETATLTANIIPSTATNKDVTWASSNDSVATVSNTGEVVAKGKGQAIITVTTVDGNKTDTCIVNVVKKVESVSLNKTSLELFAGQSYALVATVNPADADNKNVSWVSSDSTIVSVDTNGMVTANKGGTAVIVVTTEDGFMVASCTVTVKESANSVLLDNYEAFVDINGTITLTATVMPEDASDKRVTWHSEDASIATVNSMGVVTGLKVGQTEIVVTSVDGGYTARCVVSVGVPVGSVSLNKATANIESGSTLTLIATVLPADASIKDVTWSSSNQSVATVNNGVVTAVAVGTATIIVTTVHGGFTATCVVTVSKSVTNVTLNINSLTLEVGESYTIQATVLPADAIDKSLTWKSSNESVVTVNADGAIYANAKGTATITATSINGKTASVEVTVIKSVTSVTLNKNSLSLKQGDFETLVATINPADATDTSVTWINGNTNVISLSSNGKVTALSAGTATVTVKSNDGGFTSTCTVTVSFTAIDPSQISVNSGYTKYTVGSSLARKTEGFGAQFDTCIVEAENTAYYTNDDWEMFKNVVKMSNLQAVRVRFFPENFERANDNNDTDVFDYNAIGVDMNSIEMQNLYKILDLFQEVGTKVNLSFVGCRTTFTSADGWYKGSWLGGAHTALGGTKTGWLSIPDQGTDPWGEYTENVWACLIYLINEKGYTCINEYSLFPEPDDLFGSNMNMYYILEPMNTTIQLKLGNAGLEGKVMFSGPADYSPSPVISSTPADAYNKLHNSFLSKVSTFDKVTSSCYRFHGDIAQRNDTLYDIIGSAASTNKDMYDFAKYMSDKCNDYGASWSIAEGGTLNQAGAISNHDTNTYDRALTMTRYLCNLVNGGCTAINHFVFADCLYDGFMNELGMFGFKLKAYQDVSNKGSSYALVNSMPTKDFQAKPIWYAWSLIMRYTDYGSEVYPVTTNQDNDICITAFKLPDGSWTYVVANNSTSAKNVAILNGAETRASSMDVYTLSESIINGYNGELKMADRSGTVDTSKGVAHLTIPAKGIVVVSNKA